MKGKAKSTAWSWRWKPTKEQWEGHVEGQPRLGCPRCLRQISLLRGKERREGLGWAGPPGTLPPAVTNAGSLVMSICGQDCGEDTGDVGLPHGLQSHGGRLGLGLAEPHTRPKPGSSAWLFKCDGGEANKVGFTWQPVRNADSQAPPQTC